MGFQVDVEELAQAKSYRRMGEIFEQNDRGIIKDQIGHPAETMRGRLLVGVGAGALLTFFGIYSGEPFIMGMGFLPLVAFGGWLLVRWKTASDARAKQLEILAWFKARGKPFPYERGDEIIDPLERIDWEDAQTKARLATLNGERACRMNAKKAELKFFNWEYRPAVFDGKQAWAVVRKEGDWEAVDYVEVLDSGLPVFPQMFEELFPELPSMTFLER